MAESYASGDSAIFGNVDLRPLPKTRNDSVSFFIVYLLDKSQDLCYTIVKTVGRDLKNRTAQAERTTDTGS